MIEIHETTEYDLDFVQQLWADGNVMRFVGFPDGLHKTDAQMNRWLAWIQSNRPLMNHFSIYADGAYCGEAFYKIDYVHKSAALDIKLLETAQGQGIGAAGFSYAIKEAYAYGAKSVWVNPVFENKKAQALYRKLGFAIKPFPDHIASEEERSYSIYMELSGDQLTSFVS